MTSGDGNMNERNIYVNQSQTNDYENVKHGFSNRPRAPTPPPGEQFHNIYIHSVPFYTSYVCFGYITKLELFILSCSCRHSGNH